MKNHDDWLKPKKFAKNKNTYRGRSKMEWGTERVIKDWYGDDVGGREIESHQGDPQLLGNMIDGLMKEWNMDDRIVLRTLMDKWGEIIGTEFQRFTQPSILENKVLVLITCISLLFLFIHSFIS